MSSTEAEYAQELVMYSCLSAWIEIAQAVQQEFRVLESLIIPKKCVDGIDYPISRPAFRSDPATSRSISANKQFRSVELSRFDLFAILCNDPLPLDAVIHFS